MSKVVPMGDRLKVIPSFAEIEREGEAEAAAEEERYAPEIDLEDARHRVHAVNGALSSLDICPVTGAEYWAVFDREPARGVYLEWARKSLAMLQDIVDEGDKLQAKP